MKPRKERERMGKRGTGERGRERGRGRERKGGGGRTGEKDWE